MVQHSTHDNLPDASSRLYRWGVAACRHRLAILILPTLIALACLPLLATVEDRLSSGGWLPFGSEAAQVDRVLDEQFGRHATAHYLLFSDPNGSLLATETLFRREVERTVAPLRNDPSVLAIHTWGTTTNPALHPLLISDDERQSLAIVMVDQDVKTAAAEIPRLRELLTNDVLDVQIGGWPATTEDFRDLTSSDLRRAELFSVPIALAVLLVVFGGVLIAGLPLVTTALALIPTLAAVAIMSRYLETSVFTINVVVMIGLAVGIDYALILVSRYREELANHEPPHAMGVTLATAGRTIIVSGMAVAIGLLGLLTVGVDAATSTAIAASIVVFLGVLVSLSVLPAALSLLGNRVRIHGLVRLGKGGGITHRFGWFATTARAVLDRNPVPALAGSCAMLLLLAAPVLDMRPEPPGMTVLPQSQPARQMFDSVRADFSTSTLSPITLVVEPRNGRPMTNARNLNDLEAFTEALDEIEGVESVVSVWSFLPSGFGSGFLAGGIQVDEELAAVVQPYLTANAAVVEVNIRAAPGSEAAKAILDTIRTEHPRLSDGAFTVLAGGETATSVDLIGHLTDRLPWTLGLVTLATAVVLAVHFRSVLLPVKAV
ncbi:MAG: MMPL family transporter, partial [Chloroflexia bacterium]|nr:MMPL family transporter [Chloroflexia bacterium]